ncbi:MAG: HipA domain-containing protein [Candidatus Rokubacteria bacterium]|nr:HipA domain-containing protein [Candidatus Rokubacteria bacterium]MBI3826486.1 HipA domain-containing protein [Candidatus Rokubacteria bacterium]
MAGRLAIWLYGMRVAHVEEERGRLRLLYTEEALARFPLGVPLLSVSLPLSSRRYPHGVVCPFLDGLLPEGAPRRAVADELDLRASDTYGLIRDLGRDCAGALVIQPDDAPAPPHPTTVTAESLDEAEIGELVANLRSAPLGVSSRVRISLAGVHEKLLLTRMSSGSWGRPVQGTPSTHILKPEIAEYPNTVENEAFCMRLAKHLGLSVANIETAMIGGRRLLIVERYDRIVHPDGTVERIHQEDFCQATAIPPEKKYEEDGGPSLRQIAAILHAVAGPDALETLLGAITLNVLIGNGDAHAKNFSLVHDRSGSHRMAPLYDLLSTLAYSDDRLAMYIDAVHRTDRVTADRIINEAARWGLSRRHASDLITDIFDRTPAAALAARDETDGVPATIVGVLDSQLRQLAHRSIAQDARGTRLAQGDRPQDLPRGHPRESSQ